MARYEARYAEENQSSIVRGNTAGKKPITSEPIASSAAAPATHGIETRRARRSPRVAIVGKSAVKAKNATAPSIRATWDESSSAQRPHVDENIDVYMRIPQPNAARKNESARAAGSPALRITISAAIERNANFASAKAPNNNNG